MRNIAIIKSDVHVCSALKKAIKEACEICSCVRVEFASRHKRTCRKLIYSLEKEIGHLYDIQLDDASCIVSKKELKQRYKLNC